MEQLCKVRSAITKHLNSITTLQQKLVDHEQKLMQCLKKEKVLIKTIKETTLAMARELTT